MIRELRTALTLIQESIRGWVAWAVLGSVLLALLDTIGVAAMLPLMTLLTTGDPQVGIVGYISEIVGTQDVSVLVVILASLVALCFVAKSVSGILFRWWLLGHTATLTAEASVELMRRYVLSSYGAHKKRNLADVYRNIGVAVSQTYNQVGLGLLSLLSDALVLVMLAVVLLIASPIATLFAIAFFALATWSIQAFLKQRQISAGKQYLEADGEAWAAIMPGLDGFRESRLTSSGYRFVQAFGHARDSQAQAQRRTTMLGELPRYTLEVSFILAVIGMAVILFATGTQGNALAVLGVFAAASLRLLPTLNRVTATIGSVRAGQGAMRVLVGEVEKLDLEERHSEERRTTHRYSGSIEVSNVEYSYPDSEKPVLDGVSLRIQEGKTTAIVGASGAGKSTLLDIILGLIPPTSGDVFCGDRSIHEDVVAWFEAVGLVPQDVYMVDDTLENNIAYGVNPSDIDRERMAQVIDQARLSDFVTELPDGMQTRLGQRGVRLSGGQRQRVGIARALYRRPQILVLDEATSALDNVTEHQITETVASLRGDMTIIVVAHRLSTVRDADTIVFMKEGTVKSVGTFTELRRANADFERLVELGSLG